MKHNIADAKLDLFKYDPIAKFLIEGLHLSPLKAGLLWGICSPIISIGAAWINGTLLSSPGTLGLLQDWNAWFWKIFFSPVLTGYYIWGANSIENVIRKLTKNHVIEIKKQDTHRLVQAYSSRKRKILSGFLSITLGIIFFIAKSDTKSWVGSSTLLAFVLSIIFSIGTFAVSMLITAHIINVWWINATLSENKIRVFPLHPDRCGGLGILGQFAIQSSYLVVTFGFVIGITEYKYIIQGVIDKYWILHLSIPVYLASATIGIIAPIWCAHKIMKETKYELLTQIAGRYNTQYAKAQKLSNSDTSVLETNLRSLRDLSYLHQQTASFPTWPIDTTSLRRFVASVFSPFVPPILGLITSNITLLLAFVNQVFHAGN